MTDTLPAHRDGSIRTLLRSGDVRTVALAVLVNTVGTGLFLTSGVLFFTRIVGLSAPQVGFGLSLAGLLSLFAGAPLGYLADKRGPREVLVATMVCEAGAVASFALIHSFGFFLVSICVGECALTGSNACRGAIIQRVGGEDPARFRALLRSITNVGVALGGLGAGIAIQIDTRSAYVVLIGVNVCCFLLSAWEMMRLPRFAPQPRPAEASRRAALRNLPYLAVTLVNGLLCIQTSILLVALPLWLVGHTHAPRWAVPAAFLVNTALVVVFQVPASRNVRDTRAGGRALRRSGFAFLLGCCIFATLAGLSAPAALILAMCGVVLHTVGEMWQQAGAFELSFGLADEHAVGQYQGVFAMGQGIAQTLGPTLLTVLCLGLGARGWLLLGCFLAAVGLGSQPLVAWADGKRTPA